MNIQIGNGLENELGCNQWRKGEDNESLKTYTQVIFAVVHFKTL